MGLTAMPGIHYLGASLILIGVAFSDFPDFDGDYGDHSVCEGDACTDKLVFLWMKKTVPVPNKTVTYTEYEWLDVDTAGLLADCSASLSVGDIGTDMKTCRDVEREYRRACNYRKKGWLDKDGVTVKKTLDKDFAEIEGVSENILKCLGWDGVQDYYDYYGDYDFYDYYDYDYLEESSHVQRRKKRELKSNIPQFLIDSNQKRTKRNAKKVQKREK